MFEITSTRWHSAMQQPTLFDAPRASSITKSKNIGVQSRNEANERNKVNRFAQRAAVLQAVREAGSRGLTSKEYASQTGLSLNEFSGRFTELVDAGLIFRREDTTRPPKIKVDKDGNEIEVPYLISRNRAVVNWAKGSE